MERCIASPRRLHPMQATTRQQYGSSFGSSTVTECTCQAKNLFNYSRCYSNGIYIIYIHIHNYRLCFYNMFVYAVVISSTWQYFMTSFGHAPLPAPNLTSRSLCQKFQRLERVGDILLGTWANMMFLKSTWLHRASKMHSIYTGLLKEKKPSPLEIQLKWHEWKYKLVQIHGSCKILRSIFVSIVGCDEWKTCCNVACCMLRRSHNATTVDSESNGNQRPGKVQSLNFTRLRISRLWA